jgi:hypothetical protein
MRLFVIFTFPFRYAAKRACRRVVAVKHAGARHATPVPICRPHLPATATKVHTFSSITLARTSSSISRQM